MIFISGCLPGCVYSSLLATGYQNRLLALRRRTALYVPRSMYGALCTALYVWRSMYGALCTAWGWGLEVWAEVSQL